MFRGFIALIFLFGLSGSFFGPEVFATLLGGDENVLTSPASDSEPIEMPPYQAEYPEAIPEQKTAVSSVSIPTESTKVGAGMQMQQEDHSSSVSNILNPNLTEKKKKTTIVTEPQRTGVVDPSLWQKGMEEARRKVEKRIEHATAEKTEITLHIESEPEEEEVKEGNIFFRFLQRLGALFGK